MLVGNSRFDRFVGELRGLLAGAGSHEEIVVTSGSALLGELVSDASWLPRNFTLPDPDHFKQHMLYRSREGDLTILCVVWGVGQHALPHDHTVWGLVGQLIGAERTRTYAEPLDGGPLKVLSDTTLLPGQTSALSPRLGDIHSVENVADGVSVSIHVYGGDLEGLAARRRRFDPDRGAVTAFEARYN